MNHTATLERMASDPASAQKLTPRVKDDAAMLKAAANLTRDLNAPNSRIYWTDMDSRSPVEAHQQCFRLIVGVMRRDNRVERALVRPSS